MDIETLEAQLKELQKAISEAKAGNTKKHSKQPQTQQKKRFAITKIPEKSRSDVMGMIQGMNKEATIKNFGFLISNPKDTPYRCIGITHFYERENITLTGYQKPSLTYQEKHIILEKQLQGEPKKTQARVRENCLSFLTYRLKHIPETSRYGKKLTDIQREKITNALKQEIQRWD